MMLLIRMIQSLSRYGVDGKNSETQRQAGQRFNSVVRFVFTAFGSKGPFRMAVVVVDLIACGVHPVSVGGKKRFLQLSKIFVALSSLDWVTRGTPTTSQN